MRILVITSAVPYPLSTGGKFAQFGIVDRLRTHHEFAFTFPLTTAEEEAALTKLQRLWPEVTFLPFRGAQTQSRVPWSRRVERRIRSWRDRWRVRGQDFDDYIAIKRRRRAEQLRAEHSEMARDWCAHAVKIAKEGRYDVVQVDFIENASVGGELPRGPAKIFIHHEIASVRLRREYEALGLNTAETRETILSCERQEADTLGKFDAVVALSGADRIALADLVERRPVWDSPPGFATASCPQPTDDEPWRFKGALSFLGGEEHYPNLDAMMWFLESIWPQVRQRWPLLTLAITGEWKPETRIVFSRISGVVFSGFLPDLRAGLAGTVAIAPIRIGSGLRMKLMQCAALGIPIVSTTIGAEGLEWRDKQDYLRADTPDEWIEAIGNLIGKPEAGADLARSAFQRLTETFDLTRCAEKRERVYLDAAQLPRD